MSKHSKQSFARTIQVSCCCPGLCRLCPFCAPSRTRLTPTTSPGFHGKAGHLKQMNKRLLNIADPGMIANCFAHCSLKVTQFSTNSLKQSSITKPLQKLFWPSSKTFYLLLWLCWALRTSWSSSASMQSSLNWLWQNHEISTCVPHRCRKFWMLTGLHGPLSQTCYMSRSGHSMMSSMKWPSAGRFFIPPWHLVLVRYNNRSRIRPSADLIFQSRFPRSPRPPAQVTTHPNSRSLTPRN